MNFYFSLAMKVKEIKAYKASLTSDLARDLSEFEKNFILISGALLAFSISFIKDIVQISGAQILIFLFIGWLFIIVAMGLMMYTLLHSSKASHDLWRLVDGVALKNNLHDDEKDLTQDQVRELKDGVNTKFIRIKNLLWRMRVSAIISFLVGLLSMALFIGFNLVKENGKKKETRPTATTHFLIIKKDTILVKSIDSILAEMNNP